jgi:hypothetical protein
VMTIGSLADTEARKVVAEAAAAVAQLPPKGLSYQGSSWALQDKEACRQDKSQLEKQLLEVGRMAG